MRQAFTKERIDILKVLSSQISISIENAQLYSEMEGKIFEKTKDIRSILNNIEQGICTFDHNYRVNPDYSNYLGTLFSEKHLTGKNILHLLFNESNITSDQLEQIENTLVSIIGETEDGFDLNGHLLPSEVIKKDGKQIIELDWVGIMDEEEITVKMMVSIRDVTNFRLLQEKAKSRERELKMIGDVLAVTEDRFGRFIDSSSEYINICVDIIENKAKDDLEIVKQHLPLILRNLHTIKGNARTLNFEEITNPVHSAEDIFIKLNEDSEAKIKPEDLLSSLNICNDFIDEYRKINYETLNRGNSVEADEVLKTIQKNIRNKNYKEADEKISSLLEISLQDVLKPILDSIPALAQKLNKEIPDIKWSGETIYIQKDKINDFENIFIHIIRNSIDHGMDEKIKGWIEISGEKSKAGSAIIYRDSGKGLNLTKIKEKGEKQNLIDKDVTPKEIANLIFNSGFSTTEKVTEISGRGVGMDAVKTFIQEIGGDCEIELIKDKPENGYIPFKIIIELNKKKSKIKAA